MLLNYLFMNLEELFGNFVTESVPRLAVSSTKLERHYDADVGDDEADGGKNDEDSDHGNGDVDDDIGGFGDEDGDG